MTSWAALNAGDPRRERGGDALQPRDHATEEAQEAESAKLYEQALRHQQQGHTTAAQQIYTALLAGRGSEEGGPVALGMSVRLRYLCYKNLATLEAERQAFDEALTYFTEAVALDATDAVVWYYMGKAAIETGRLWLARQALEKGFATDATLWPLVQTLCEVLHAIGDYEAFRNVAAYLLEKDPHCRSVGALYQSLEVDLDKEAVSFAKAKDVPMVKTRSQEIAVMETAQRKRLAEERNIARKGSVAPVEYVLQQSSWSDLGKLLLVAYDDVSQSTEDMARGVRIRADFSADPPTPQPIKQGKVVDHSTDNVIDLIDQETHQDGPHESLTNDRASRPSRRRKRSDSMHSSTEDRRESDVDGDGERDTEERSAPRGRRKSRRHEERLREEHATAVKLAREKDLQYRLQVFIPSSDKSVAVAPIADSDGRYTLHIQQGALQLLEGGRSVHIFERFTPTTSRKGTAGHQRRDKHGDGSTIAGQTTASAGDSGGGGDRESDLQPLHRQQIQQFIEQMNMTDEGRVTGDVVSMLRRYLNQCGEWAHLRLHRQIGEAININASEDNRIVDGANDSEDIHNVCLWAEKAVRGRLLPLSPALTPKKHKESSRVAVHRSTNDGLTIHARLFLLELQVDLLLLHPVGLHEVSVHKQYLQKLENALVAAQRLLLDVSWHSEIDGNETDETKDDSDEDSFKLVLARLFWLYGLVCERRGEPNLAKGHYIKCLEELETASVPTPIRGREKGGEEASELVIQRTNLCYGRFISRSILEKKISGLQFSDVRAAASKYCNAGEYDRARQALMGHYFPDDHTPRIIDLLQDYGNSHGLSNGATATVLAATVAASVSSNADAEMVSTVTSSKKGNQGVPEVIVQDEDDISVDSMLELLVKSVQLSSEVSADMKCSVVVALLHEITQLMRASGVNSTTHGNARLLDKGIAQDGKRKLMTSAIGLLLRQLCNMACGDSVALSDNCLRAISVCTTVLLEPALLVLFDSPRIVFALVCDLHNFGLGDHRDKSVGGEHDDPQDEHGDQSSVQSGIHCRTLLLSALWRSFHRIRGFTVSDLRSMLGEQIESSKKKKHSSRQDHIRMFLVDSLRYFSKHVPELIGPQLPSVITQGDVRALMMDCCKMIKEEEEIARRHGDRTSQQLFVAGAILFLQLFASDAIPSLGDKRDVQPHEREASSEHKLKALVSLVNLLHDRVGQLELCALTCSTVVKGHEDDHDSSLNATPSDESFVEVVITLLSARLDEHDRIRLSTRLKNQKTHRRRKKAKLDAKLGSDGDTEGDMDIDNEENVNQAEEHTFEEDPADEGEENLELALAQCFSCLYDVHVLPGCVDHKTGSSISRLESASSSRTNKMPRAIQLARFAVPIMLKRAPTSNAQKKENLGILSAIRDAIALEMPTLRPCTPSTELLEFISPTTLLSWRAPLPVFAAPRHGDNRQEDERAACLDHFWFLLGENFIMPRVRRRSHLGELLDVERKVKERIAYLLKDVQYYRPDRVKSWVRMGRTMKELYHVASDACLLIIGRQRKRAAMAAYDTDLYRTDRSDGLSIASFKDLVLRTSLFENLTEWSNRSDDGRSKFRVCIGDAPGTIDDTTQGTLSMEAFAVHFVVQIVEFALRCFRMAAALAERDLRRDLKDDNGADKHREEAADEFDEEREDELRTTVVECNEECGLLLYNILQEFAVFRRGPHSEELVAFPIRRYERIIDATLDHFQRGLTACQSDPDAHEIRFRLNYMMGKALKKKQWPRRLQIHDAVNPEAIPNEGIEMQHAILSRFATAEQAHEDGKMDSAIVQAFYQLQTIRMELILMEPVTREQLSLATDHYFDEAVDDEDDDDDDEEEKEHTVEKDRNGPEGNPDRKNSGGCSQTDKVTSDCEDLSAPGSATPTFVSKMSKDAVYKLLALADENDDASYLHLARIWLFVNVMEALDSIPDEDRYFHPSQFVLAQCVYRLDDFMQDPLLKASHPMHDAARAALAKRRTANGNGSRAELALKELLPLFDKRRPQIVAIWLSEHIPSAKKFEELNQRQMKFDVYRVKYWHFYVHLLQECDAHSRLKEVCAWVWACKEEHDVIDEMLGVVLEACGKVQLKRLRHFVDEILASDSGETDASVKAMATEANSYSSKVVELTTSEEDPSQTLLKHLGKAYLHYLEVTEAEHRVMEIVPEITTGLLPRAEFALVCLFVLGAHAFPSLIQVPSRLEEVVARSPISLVAPAIRQILEDDAIPVASSAWEEWRPFVDAAVSFCDGTWPERRLATGKHSRNRARTRPSTTATTTTTAGIASGNETAAAPTAVTIPVTTESRASVSALLCATPTNEQDDSAAVVTSER